MKVIIDIPKEKILQVRVPEHIKKCKIVNYGFAGTWLVEDSKELNAWKIALPRGNYEALGRFKDVLVDFSEPGVETTKNYLIRIL